MFTQILTQHKYKESSEQQFHRNKIGGINRFEDGNRCPIGHSKSARVFIYVGPFKYRIITADAGRIGTDGNQYKRNTQYRKIRFHLHCFVER